MLEKFLETAFSEYGLLVAVLLIAVYVLFMRTIKLTEYIMTHLKDSNETLTKLTVLITGKSND